MDQTTQADEKNPNFTPNPRARGGNAGANEPTGNEPHPSASARATGRLKDAAAQIAAFDGDPPVDSPAEARPSIARLSADDSTSSVPASSFLGKEAEPSDASPAAGASLSPEQLKDITGRLAQLRPRIEAKDPALAKEIWQLDGALSWDFGSAHDPKIQARVAYALEDAEKLAGKLVLPPAVRQETARLASTSPGFENKELETLLRQTSSIDDPALVKDLRDKAAVIGASKDSAIDEVKTREDIYALAFRVATAPRITPPAAQSPDNRVTPGTAATSRSEAQAAPSFPAAPSHTSGAPEGPPGRIKAAAEGRRADAAAETRTGSSAKDAAIIAAERPKHANTKPAQETEAGPAGGTPATVTAEETHVRLRPVFGGRFGNLLRNVHEAAKEQLPGLSPRQAQPETPAQASTQATNKPAQTSLASRLDSYNANRRQPQRDTEAVESAHGAAHDALTALNKFRAAEGAALINKINDAAKTAKGGIREVLSGMRTGGAYEDLRKEFDTLYNETATFRDSYDKAATALAGYGDRRAAITLALQNQPQGEIASKIKALDEQIAKASSDIPGETHGQTITEKLAEKAREIVDAILEKIRKTFGHDHEPSPNPSPSPSP
jgi:hypothetical protein